jgi:N-methylhydantoinase A
MLAYLGHRKVWWKHFGGFRDTDAFQLEKLVSGNVVKGPAIIEAYGTSIPLHPGQHAHVDEWLNVVIEVSSTHTSAELQPTRVVHPRDETIGADA